MPNLQQMAMLLLQQNPNVANTPQGKQFMQILQSGDAEAGQKMADNICSSYGVTRDDALDKAKQFFKL